MFAVLFEVHPKPDKWDAYLGLAKLLRPELEKVGGFIDNIRYGSLTREGCLLSLSTWRDEKALVRWRTEARHHAVQEKGRFDIFRDYRLRVGQFTRDTHLPEGQSLRDQRLDETAAGDATAVVLVTAETPPGAWSKDTAPEEIARRLGLEPQAPGLVAWDLFDAVLTPGDLILMLCWRKPADADAFEAGQTSPAEARLRRIRIIRDYGMSGRDEAPQYFAQPGLTEVARFGL